MMIPRHYSTRRTLRDDLPVHRHRSHAQRWRRRLLLAALALLITFICGRSSCFLSYPEFALLDCWLRARPARDVSDRIVLIGIEASDVRQSERSKPAGCTCMLVRRDILARGISLCKSAGASVLGLDVVFELPCLREHDAPLEEALEEPGQTVILSGARPSPGRFDFKQMPQLASLSNPIMASPVLYWPRGVVRGVQLIQRDEQRLEQSGDQQYLASSNVCPPFALACYAASVGRGHELPQEQPWGAVHCADVNIPIWYGENVLLTRSRHVGGALQTNMLAMLINWAGPAGTYPCYSFNSILQASGAERRLALAGKIVLIGSMSDRQRTPMSGRHPSGRSAIAGSQLRLVDQSNELHLSGLEVHANALETVLQRRFIRLPNPALNWLLMFVLALLTMLLSRPSASLRAVVFAITEMGVVVLAARYLVWADYWLYVATPAAAVALATLSGQILAVSEARSQTLELDRALKSRDRATSTLVHDLKQPLVAINTLAQVLRAEQSGGDSVSREVIGHIQNQVQLALGDIDELLATDPQRTLRLKYTQFDLAELARDLAVPQSLKTGQHQVQVVAPEGGVSVTADPRYMARALSNLMDNAIKYWPGGGTVLVEVQQAAEMVTVRVTDHGIGIPAEAQASIFDRFSRAVPDDLDIPGTGIGLHSVRRIVEAHGGTVTLRSVPAEGSTFSLSLPVKPAVEPAKGTVIA